MSLPHQWPSLRWRGAAVVFGFAAAVVSIVLFNFWPETAYSTVFRATIFAAVVAFAMAFMRRPKSGS